MAISKQGRAEMLAYAPFWLGDLWEIYLLAMRRKLRYDLRDFTPTYRWTDEELDRAINRAVSELSNHFPIETITALFTVSGNRDVDISSLSPLVKVNRLEYPLDQNPRRFQRYDVYAQVLTITSGSTPSGDSCKVYWGKAHTLTPSESTVPQHMEDILLMGAAAFAVLARAQDVTEETIGAGAGGADEDYTAWGKYTLQQFYNGINRQMQKRRITSTRLFTED